MSRREFGLRLAPPGSFGARILTMVTGTAIAQIVPIAISPALTRLYTQEAFGAFGLYVAVAAVLSVIGTGRYELSILLPERTQEARSLFSLTLMLALGASVLCGAGFVLFREPVIAWLDVPDFEAWLMVLPGSVFLMGAYQALNYLNNREKRFRWIAASLVTQQSVAAGVSLSVGWTGVLDNGLIAGYVFGQAAATLVLAWPIWRESRSDSTSSPLRGILAAAREYRKFPLFNLPYSLLTAISARAVVIALNLFGHVRPAGHYTLSRSMAFAPVSFLSASLGQVFYREAVSSWKTPALEALVRRIMFLLAEVSAPVCAFLVLWAPDLLGFVFGERWREAGPYVAWLIPVAYAGLFTSWPERIYEVARKQQISLAIQVVCDTVSVSLLVLLLSRQIAPLRAVMAFALVSIAYHVVYLVFMFRVAGFRSSTLFGLLARTAIGAGALGAAFFFLREALPRRSLALAAGAALLIVSLAVWAWFRGLFQLRPDSAEARGTVA